MATSALRVSTRVGMRCHTTSVSHHPTPVQALLLTNNTNSCRCVGLVQPHFVSLGYRDRRAKGDGESHIFWTCECDAHEQLCTVDEFLYPGSSIAYLFRKYISLKKGVSITRIEQLVDK